MSIWGITGMAENKTGTDLSIFTRLGSATIISTEIQKLLPVGWKWSVLITLGFVGTLWVAMETTSFSVVLLSGFKRMSTKPSEPETTGKAVLKLPWKKISLVSMYWNNVDWHTWYLSLARWDTDFKVVAKVRRPVSHGQHSKDVSP